MAVESVVSGIANTSNSYQASSKGKSQSGDLDKEAFLQLLVTQMQYQDPLNPSDSTQYMSQLAQYSSLEAQMNISETLERGNSLNLVGQYVIMNTTDASGASSMISGLVEYATVKDGDVYLSINDTYYPAEDLDSVVDYDYYLYLQEHLKEDGTIDQDAVNKGEADKNTEAPKET
ncbi:MAG: flagellar hook assembly protein FlgD [Wujia sp.]